MRITRIEANLALTDAVVVAFCNLIFDDVFIVRNIRVIKSLEGKRLVCMPSRRTTQGVFKDMAHPLTSDFRLIMEKAILSCVDELLEKSKHTETINATVTE